MKHLSKEIFGRTQFKWAKISNEAETEILDYIFEDKWNVPWSYVLTIWLSGVLNSLQGNKCPTWNVLVLKHIIGGSREGPAFPPPTLGKKKKIAEGRKAGRVSDRNLGPLTYTFQC